MTTLFSADYLSMLLRFGIFLLVSWFITHVLYYRKSHRRDFYFTFVLISVAIFFLVYFMIFVLEDLKGKTGIGIGIGLFGIFSIMRYRTDTMPVREMTYLFVLIALAVVNALASTMPLPELLATNIIVILLVWAFESALRTPHTKLIQYDRIELIRPDRRAELIADLEERLGLRVQKVEVGGADFLRDMAVIRVYYDDEQHEPSDVDNMTKTTARQLATFNNTKS